MTTELRAAKEDAERVSAKLLDTNRVLELEKRQREQAQTHLRRHTKQLELQNRELQDKFAHMASHDLQEPLHKIQAFGDLVSSTEAERLSESGLDYVKRMRQAAARMRELIDDLLALSHITSQARPLIAVDLAAIASEVLSDLETRIERTGGARRGRRVTHD